MSVANKAALGCYEDRINFTCNPIFEYNLPYKY